MLIKVTVKANSRNDILEFIGDRYIVSVKEKASGGMANARALELLAKELNVPTRKIRIVKGRRSPSKILEIK